MKAFTSFLTVALLAATTATYVAAESIDVEEPHSCVQLVELGPSSTVYAVLHTCGERRRLLTWGNNDHGQLGHGNSSSSLPQHPSGNSSSNSTTTPPVVVLPPSSNSTSQAAFVDVDADVLDACSGTSHTCILVSSEDHGNDLNSVKVGEVKCFGSNEFGQLGHPADTEVTDLNTLPPVDVGGELVSALTCGPTSTCVLLADSKSIKCFGNNAHGEAGLDSTAPTVGQHGEELERVKLDFSFSSVTFGSSVCALSEDGEVYCWGANVNGELGSGTPNPIGSSNDSMAFLAENPVDLGLGDDGFNVTVPPVNVTVPPVNVTLPPINVTLPPTNVTVNTTIPPMRRRLRGLQSEQDDYYDYDQVLDDVDVNNIPSEDVQVVESVHAGLHFACAVIVRAVGDRGIKCWGYGALGVLGYENSNNVGLTHESMGLNLSYVNYGSRSIQKFSAGSYHACVLFGDRTAACYGDVSYGQAGLNDSSSNTIGATNGSMGDHLQTIAIHEPIHDVVAGLNTTLLQVGKFFEVFAMGVDGHEEGKAAVDLGVCTSTGFLEFGFDIRIIDPNNQTNGTATLAPSVIGNATWAPSVVNVTSAPSTIGNATLTPTIVGNATLVPSVVGNATMTPTFVGNATMAPSVMGNTTMTPTVVSNATSAPTLSVNVTLPPFSVNATLAPSISTNFTTAPTLSGNSSQNNNTKPESPYFIRNPLSGTTVVVLVTGPDFVSSPEFNVPVELGPGETKMFEIQLHIDEDSDASMGVITGTYWCKGDSANVFDLPEVKIGFDVPPASEQNNTSNNNTGGNNTNATNGNKPGSASSTPFVSKGMMMTVLSVFAAIAFA